MPLPKALLHWRRSRLLPLLLLKLLLTYVLFRNVLFGPAAESRSEHCVCAESGMSVCYESPVNGRLGAPLDCRWGELLEKEWRLGEDIWELPEAIEPVFVTATSENHFREGMRTIAQTQHTFPSGKILFYDLGLSREQRGFVESLCRVEVRDFDFDRFFPKERLKRMKLSACRWKPLIIAEALSAHPSIWYMDASVRWYESAVETLAKSVYPRVLDGTFAPYLTVDPTGHSIHATTHPMMYRYLPILERERTQGMMVGAGFALILRSPLVRRLLKWYTLCALKRSCMIPIGASPNCHFRPGANKTVEWGNCHRYDQSALNVLLANEFKGDFRKYITNGEPFGFIDRSPGNFTHPLQHCKPVESQPAL